MAGDFNNFGFDDIDGIIELQELAKEELQMAGQKVDKPFFAFDVYNSQYSEIFLDETKEDPKVYLVSPFLAKGGEMPLIKPNNWEFTALVNKLLIILKTRYKQQDPTLTPQEIAKITTTLPYNLDAWDGYFMEREQFYSILAGKNVVVLAGDTHHAWLGKLTDAQGKFIGIELACSSVSSQGLEGFWE